MFLFCISTTNKLLVGLNLFTPKSGKKIVLHVKKSTCGHFDCSCVSLQHLTIQQLDQNPASKVLADSLGKIKKLNKKKKSVQFW